MKNNLIILLDAQGNLITEPIGQLRANAEFNADITVIAPFDLTTVVSATFTKNNRVERDITQYLVPNGTITGKDRLGKDHPEYQRVYDYNVFEGKMDDVALAYVAKFRAGLLFMSIGMNDIIQPPLATNYKGKFGHDVYLPEEAENGDFYICDEYNFNDKNFTFTLDDYAYFYNGKWFKSNYRRIGGTDTFEVSVSPNLKSKVEVTVDQDLGLLLAGKVVVLERAVSDLEGDYIGLEARVEINEQYIDDIKLKDIDQDNRLDIIESDIIDIEEVDRNQSSTLQDHEIRITKNTQDIAEINEGLVKIDEETITRNDDEELEVSTVVLDDIESRVLKNEFETFKITNNNKINAVENGLQIQIDEMEFVVDITLVGNDIKVEHRDGDVTYIPVNEAVESGYYDTNTKELVLELANGDEIRIPSGDIVAGLASVDYVDTGLALKENKSNKITELVGVPNNTQYMSAKLTNDLIMAARTEINSMLDNKVDKVTGKGLSANDYTDGEKDKLSGIEAGAEVNPYSKTQLDNMFDDKVDKVSGKGLSTNDFTNNDKNKLDGIEAGAEVNEVNSVNGKTGTVVIDKSDVGLPNADDTADLDKPISTDTQTALDLKADKTELTDYVTTTTFDMQMLEKLAIKPNGSDLLIIGGMINPLYIDDASYKANHPTVNSQAAMLALDVPAGTVVVRLDTPSKELFLLTQLPASTLANWQVVSSNTVVSVAGKTGVVVLGITDISGLNSALNLKLDITTFESQLTQLQADIADKTTKTEFNTLSSNFDTHIGNTSNPHNVTKAQVGLSNVTNDKQFTRAEFDKLSLVGVNNLGLPDLEGKEYLGNGEYRLYNGNGIAINYNVYSGIFTSNGTTTNVSGPLLFSLEQNTEYTLSFTRVSGTNEPFWIIGQSPYQLIETIYNATQNIQNTFTTTSQKRLILEILENRTFNNYKFKLQLEKGSQATDYQIPLQPIIYHETKDIIETILNSGG